MSFEARYFNAKFEASLCASRHPMPVERSIFPEVINPLDTKGLYSMADAVIPAGTGHLVLYVTGLTAAFAAVVSVCVDRKITLTAMHYNKDTGDYYPQYVLAYPRVCPFCGTPIAYGDTYCPNCGST